MIMWSTSSCRASRMRFRPAEAELIVRGPVDIFTVSGLRVPDIGVIDRADVLAALRRDERAHQGADVRLVVEVISRDSGSERTDRYEKPGEYAATGIPHYWVVDLEPSINVTLYQLTSRYGTYRRVDRVFAGTTLKVDDPVPIEFDPGDLLMLD